MMLGLMNNQTARAQAAPPPIGSWANKTEGLVAQQSGTCGFLVNGKVRYSGTCKWETPRPKAGFSISNIPCLSRPATFAGA
jgi:hypothetical protein